MMTQTEQRIAIAEWMGFKGIYQMPCDNKYFGWLKDSETVELPNYPLDLNAMHETEKKLDEAQECIYYDELCRLTGDEDGAIYHYYACHSSSQQRSEALCRTLWPERFEQ